jgi:hypothetical protein
VPYRMHPEIPDIYIYILYDITHGLEFHRGRWIRILSELTCTINFVLDGLNELVQKTLKSFSVATITPYIYIYIYISSK